MQKKAEMLDLILTTRTDWKEVIEWAGLDTDKLLYNDEQQSQVKSDDLNQVVKWMKKVNETYYIPWLRYYRQATPEYWQRLVHYGEPEIYPEYVALQELTSDFVKQLRSKTKPDFFKKSRIYKILPKKAKK